MSQHIPRQKVPEKFQELKVKGEKKKGIRELNQPTTWSSLN